MRSHPDSLGGGLTRLTLSGETESRQSPRTFQDQRFCCIELSCKLLSNDADFFAAVSGVEIELFDDCLTEGEFQQVGKFGVPHCVLGVLECTLAAVAFEVNTVHPAQLGQEASNLAPQVGTIVAHEGDVPVLLPRSDRVECPSVSLCPK